MEYGAAWELQRTLFNARLANAIDDVLLLLEHPHTYTIGKSGGDDHLLVSEQDLARRGIEVFRIDRGGDITYHGPGQLVGYPIFNLNQHYRDVHRYLRDLEEILIRTIADYGIEAGRIPGLTGVWVRDEKIAAIGVKVSRWVTMHGFAFNINTDLQLFTSIIPCGIVHKSVTSLARLLTRPLDLREVAGRVMAHTGTVFQSKPEEITLQHLVETLEASCISSG